MKSLSSVLMLLAAFLLVAAPGCGWTHSHTTTDNGTQDSVLVDVTEQDINTMSNVVTIASHVWDLVSTIISATKSAKADTVEGVTSVCTSVTLLDGSKLTKDDVLKKSNVILFMCYKEAKKFPAAAEVAVYIRNNSLPSESALIRFAQTGLLSE